LEYRSQPISRSPWFETRWRLTALAVILLLLALAGRTGWLTIIRGERYAEAARDNPQSIRRLEAPRGNLFDREGRPVALNRKAYSLTFSRYGLSREQVHESLRRLGELLGEDFLSREEEILATTPSWTRHRLARRLAEGSIVPVLEAPSDFPGVRLESDFLREYPFGPALAHVIGYVGKIPPELVDRYERPTYLPDAYIGRSGIERAFEDRLVGKPGRERWLVDARGRRLAEPEVLEAARAGDDLALALDARLQMAALDALGDSTGCAILMDAHTGELLVLASTPVYDPLAPGSSEVDGRPASQLNRTLAGLYPPGSTFKVVTASAWLRAGHAAGERFDCSGSFSIGVWRWGCTGVHGGEDLLDALMHSCNVFFYEAGDRLGGPAIMAEAARFGFGSPTGADLPGEQAGSLPDRSAAGARGETLNLSIGQGAMLSTPLQVARAYAALANGGSLVHPRAVQGVVPPQGGRPVPLESSNPPRLDVSPARREAIIEGLARVVSDPSGTASKASFPADWGVCGKTGTAEVGPERRDAWFAGFFPRSSPRHVIVVQVEDAEGHGGEVAAPIAREVIAALLDPPEDPPVAEEVAAADSGDRTAP